MAFVPIKTDRFDEKKKNHQFKSSKTEQKSMFFSFVRFESNCSTLDQRVLRL